MLSATVINLTQASRHLESQICYSLKPTSLKELVHVYHLITLCLMESCQVMDSDVRYQTMAKHNKYQRSSLSFCGCFSRSSGYRNNRPVIEYAQNDLTIARNIYENIAAIRHSRNNARFGHYQCLLKNRKEWLCINNDNIASNSGFHNKLTKCLFTYS